MRNRNGHNKPRGIAGTTLLGGKHFAFIINGHAKEYFGPDHPSGGIVEVTGESTDGKDFTGHWMVSLTRDRNAEPKNVFFPKQCARPLNEKEKRHVLKSDVPLGGTESQKKAAKVLKILEVIDSGADLSAAGL